MGTNISCLVIRIIFCALFWPHIQASQYYTPQTSLNSFLYNYALRNIVLRPRTGQLYNVSLPANFSGIEISIIRLRTHSLWQKGLNLSTFQIPPRTLPWPFTNRVDFLYQNLGNWSTFYYNVPNYTFVAPVIGLVAYDANTSSMERGLIELNLTRDDPIIVRFQNMLLDSDGRMKCVRFGTNGTLEFTELTLGSSCVARGHGHFSVVVPRQNEEKREFKFKWWIVGIVIGGVVGLILVILIGVLVYKFIKWKKVWKMEKHSGESEALGAIWIGNSKMPTASGIRTQPSFEDSYVP
ncbi:hypothetical protein PHJA_001289500 [Phtheirospermum japonicum]|uniref:Uncharacterized protein n=1 Tax=Phtheirospermum japonicum TaxID=374723 RepID=A0A830C840_9LAMI|nr:hypothetical protein PHJA_001289500 [Phtheirospermum japonicum]